MTHVREEILGMAGYTPGEQPQAGKFIKLNTNENPYPASPQVTQAIRRALDSGLARYPDPLCDSFRHRAAEVLGVDPDWILCGNGSDDILTIVTRAFVAPGKKLRLPFPSYTLYHTLAQLQGAVSEAIPFRDNWSLDEKFYSHTHDLQLAFLPNPNSPSGTLLSPEEIRNVLEQLPCPLLIDEAYVDFATTDCLALVRENERLMISRTLSKSYALAGLRFGFLIAQPQVIRQLLKVKDSYNCDTLSIAGATAAIDDQRWLAENRAKVLATRERLTKALSELGFSALPSQANFVWSPHSGRPVQPLYEQLKSNRILVRYMKYEGWQDGLRISVGTDEQIDACLTLLKSMV